MYCIVQDCFDAVTAELSQHSSDIMAHKAENIYSLV